ncbi:MAG: GntR family transcriptional regulator [Chloroflexota bacterium]
MRQSEQPNRLVDQVYAQVLSLLYKRGLAGSEGVNAESLANNLGVSRTPVNMALMRLEQEGLVRWIPGKGWSTAPLTLADIQEIFDLKDYLEPLVARKAAENITPEKARELLAAVEQMERASQEGDLETWLAADRRYHDLLFNVAGNKRLRSFQDQLNKQLYRLWIGHASMSGQMSKSCAEHRLVAEAVASSDAEAAEAHALKHVRRLRASLVEVIQNILIPFLGNEL